MLLTHVQAQVSHMVLKNAVNCNFSTAEISICDANTIFSAENLQMCIFFCNFVCVLCATAKTQAFLICQIGITNTRKETKNI